MDYKLELILLPVADVDRSKAFYLEQAGFDLLVDHRAGESFRVVQAVPPGSACAIGFGVGLSSAPPGTTRGLHLMVADIVSARDELFGRGVEISEVRHLGSNGQWGPGAHPDRSDYNSFADFADPDGNTWVLQERGFGS